MVIIAAPKPIIHSHVVGMFFVPADIAIVTPVASKSYRAVRGTVEPGYDATDLQSDPNELRSVYSDPANADLVTELKAEIVRLQKLYQVPDDRGKLKASDL